ncbi:hypothetical protein L6R53_28565 [Myxococcota bacterium]|nr:hypothetical protein [Myxococcota bacterium]
MRRHHLFELADAPWLPDAIKDGVTDNLQLGLNLFRPYDVVVPRLADLLRQTGAERILDLGSGGAGPWRTVLERLRQDGVQPSVILSDLQPSRERLGEAVRDLPEASYWPHPADARDLPPELRAVPVRTMFTALHHLQEEDVRGLVACCVRDRVGFGAFEFTERRPREVVLSFVAAFTTTLVFAPTFWRGWTVSGLRRWATRILLSPVIALVNAWDGAVSVLRTYTPEEIRVILDSVPGAQAYTWEVGLADAPGMSSRVLYVVGRPEEER